MDADVKEQFDTIIKRMGAQDSVLATLETSVNRVVKKIEGNGRAGIDERLTRIEERHNELVTTVGTLADALKCECSERERDLQAAASKRKDTTDCLQTKIDTVDAKVDDVEKKIASDVMPSIRIAIFVGSAMLTLLIGFMFFTALGGYEIVKAF